MATDQVARTEHWPWPRTFQQSPQGSAIVVRDRHQRAPLRVTVERSMPLQFARDKAAATPQSRMVWSASPVARIVPSGENATEYTSWQWPFRWASSRPLEMSQRVASPAVSLGQPEFFEHVQVRLWAPVYKPPTVARTLPSGEKAIAWKCPVRLSRVCFNPALPPSQSASLLAGGIELDSPGQRSPDGNL